MGKNKRVRTTPGRKNGDFWDSEYRNKLDFIHYFNRLAELSMCMFEWKGLPDTIDERFLETCLLYDGMTVFFHDDVLGYLCLQTMIGGRMDVYRIPIERKAWATNGYNKILTNEDSVLIFNNMLHTNSVPDIIDFAQRLWEYDRIIDINVKAQKTPILLSCEESQRLTIKNLYMKYEGNEPFIFGDKSLTPNTIKSISTEAPFISDKLYMLKTQYWNEAMSFFGIPNTNIQKKERLITDEVQRNMGGTIASRLSRLNARQQACKQINQMFGLNVSCDFSEAFTEMIKEIENNDQDKEVIGNE